MSELALQRIAENKAKHARGEDARVLDLGDCGLKEVPEEVGELVWLEELNLSNYEPLGNDFGGLIAWHRKIRQNNGEANQIPFLPPSLPQLKLLKKLLISKTQVSDLSLLAGLAHLNHLDCSHTQVSDLSLLAGLTHLNHLDCSHTQVSDLSPLAGLTHLNYLYCSYIQVSDLSPLAGLTHLYHLDCSYTQVSDLSPLTGLTNTWITLIFISTKVTDLSPILFLIKYISVYWKNISEADPAHDVFAEHAMILVKDCPLIHPPPEIVKQGNPAILNYFAEHEKAQFKNTEIKLILTGNSTAGKTSLSQYLRERTFKEGQPTTHGILNQQWQPEGRDLQVNLWDFGGQEYYHATHRLFLSHNAVYALVWDKETDKGGFCETSIHFDNDPEPSILRLEHFPQKWWLQNIRHYTRESNPPVPVLMVQNKSARDGVKRVSGEFEKAPFGLLPEWLDNHIDLAAAADPQHPEHKKWLRQFEAFEEVLLNKLQSQLAHYEFAVYHRDIRDKVRQLAAEGVNDMPYPDFEKLCRDIEADAKMDLVQIYLRDITGDILYYPHNERLRERVFLRPAWVCSQIYAILSRKVLEKQGVFDVEWVCEALGASASDGVTRSHPVTATAEDFVELMREFELVFPESDDDGKPTGQLVAPQYLPDSCTKPDKLEAAKEYANLNHAFTLWFPDFLPKSHIARFVAHWGSQAKQRLFWKNGLLFQTEGCTALVERVGEDKIRVDIQIGEKTKREAAMQRIFQSFLKLEDEQPGFAVSLDAGASDGVTRSHPVTPPGFVWWRDVQKSLELGSRKVEPFHPEGAKSIDIQPFAIFQKPVKSMKKVFISYSKSDKTYLEDFKVQLASLRRQNLIETWDDTDLLPGQEWDAKIRKELKTANIIVLLISPDLIATDYIWEVEMKEALSRHERGEATVIPVIIRSCIWEDTPFGKLTALPEKGKPIDIWDNKGEAWMQVVGKIKRTIAKEDSHIPIEADTPNDEPMPSSPMTEQVKLKILMLTANPAGRTELSLKEEHSRIVEKLQNHTDRFTLLVRHAVGKEEFKEFIETEKPQILHFSGHGEPGGGTEGGIIVLNKEKNDSSMISTDALDALFEYFKELGIRLQTVLLNACHSEYQAQAIAKHVPYVIGTSIDIGDMLAIDFSAGFYFKLAEPGAGIETAYKSGRTQAITSGAKKSHFVLYINGQKAQL